MKKDYGFFRRGTDSNELTIALPSTTYSTSFIGEVSAASRKWRLINKDALKILLPNAPIATPALDLIKASFNEAIDCLNRTANENKRLSLGDLGLILKKFQQKGMWEREEDALFLYDYIKTTGEQEENNVVETMNEIHRYLIEFYVTHHDHFSKNEKFYVIEKATKIFELYPSKNTFAALIQGYLKAKEYEKAWRLCMKEESIYRSGYLYDFYFKILFHLSQTIVPDQKTGLQRAREHYDLIYLQYHEALNTHSYRSVLELYYESLDDKQSDHEKEILLSEVNDLYSKIPNEMKNDQVCRIMLRIILRHESFDSAVKFFNMMKESKYVNLTDMSYQRMIEAYFNQKRYQDAEDLLDSAFKAGNLLMNKPFIDSVNNYAELNLHLAGTTGGGTPLYGGTPSSFNSLAIHYLLLSLKLQYSNSGQYSMIKVKIICGKGAGKVRESAEEILNFYKLRYEIDGRNTGCLITNISNSRLNSVEREEFFIPKLPSNDNSQQIINDSSKTLLHSQSTSSTFSGENVINSSEITTYKREWLVSLMNDVKKSIYSNNKVLILFDDYAKAQNIHGKLLEALGCNGGKNMAKKITRNLDADYDRYSITLSKDEYNAIMGKNAFDELFLKINSTLNIRTNKN